MRLLLMVNLLLGIGNPDQGDDGAGNYIAGQMDSPVWTALDCGTVPENFTGVVRRLHPAILVLVDAADMKIPAGEFRIVPSGMASAPAIGTHHLPLAVLIEYLEPLAGRILLICIQPETLEREVPLSDTVREGANRLVRLIERQEFDKIPVLGEIS